MNFGIIDDTKIGVNRFTCGFVLARIVGEKLIITYLGDCGFRINGKELYKFEKQLDIDHAEMRAKFINETGDVEGGYAHVKPSIINQFQFQNDPDHELGYGALDGTSTPEKFVEVFEYNLDQVKTLELFTDGYFDYPDKPTVEEWEKTYERVEKEDPGKYLKYKSVKSRDDRTVMIVNF
jgi:serine/threonine protein phosphatase PrpC